MIDAVRRDGIASDGRQCLRVCTWESVTGGRYHAALADNGGLYAGCSTNTMWFRWEMRVVTKIAVSMVVIPKRSVYGRYVIEKWIDNMKII